MIQIHFNNQSVLSLVVKVFDKAYQIFYIIYCFGQKGLGVLLAN